MKQGATARVSVLRRPTEDGWIQTQDCDGGHGRDRVEDGLEGGGRTRTSRNSGTAVSVIE